MLCAKLVFENMNKKLLDSVQSTILKFNLFGKSDLLVIAYSGGKDSLFTILILKELGYSILPVAIDLNYSSNWSERIKAPLEKYGINCCVISVANSFDFHFDEIIKDISPRIKYLLDLKTSNDKLKTPCTQCYNIKLLSLIDYCISSGIKYIVFGHHLFDAISSFLKSYVYYIDRWEQNNNSFGRNNIQKVIAEIKPYFFKDFKEFIESSFYASLKELTKERNVATDEPPKQIATFKNYNLQVVRPLLEIYEEDLVLLKNKNKIQTEKSGCGHSLAIELQSTREMIHFGILKEMPSNSNSKMIFNELFGLIEYGLDIEGKLFRDVRNERNLILGSQYKNGFGTNNKI